MKYFFHVDISKMHFFENYSFVIVITQNDHPRYVMLVLGRIFVFFTRFGHWGGAGGFKWDWYTTHSCRLSPYTPYFFDMANADRQHTFPVPIPRQRHGRSKWSHITLHNDRTDITHYYDLEPNGLVPMYYRHIACVR